MFGCSDVYHWMGRTAKAVWLPDCGRTCLPLSKSYHLDATIFWFRAPKFRRPRSGIASSARHRRLTGDFGACYPECTLRAKRKIAAWDDDFLASLIVA